MAQTANALVNGRYRTIRSLGQGGMGTVFLAADMALEGRPVALKRLHHSSLSPESIASLKAEFEAMTRLRHPNVVEVYDFGVDQDDGEHFLTLEYVEGADIQQRAAGLPLPGKLELLVDVCRGLGYIHASGLLHNDIKIQNIMVTSGTPATCKLMDFGLASAGSVRQAPGVRGTLQYLAPELIRGAAGSPRSDLYALGVVFYRVLAGRLPFDGVADEVLRRATTEAPDPPSRWNPELSPALDALVLRMLAKDPAERPVDAADVVRELSQASGVTHRMETPATRTSRIRGAALVGRDREIEKLVALIRRSHSPQTPGAGLALISGETGSGKSRIVRQLRYEAQLRGSEFASGRCYEGSGAAFHPFVQILRQIAPWTESDPVLSALLAPAGPQGAPGAASPRSAAEAESELRRVIDSVVQAVVTATARRPLIVCIEDIQWADQASLLLLEHLARNGAADPAARRLIIAATYRSEEAETPPLSAALPRLGGAAPWERIELSRLGPGEIASLLAEMLGQAAPHGLVEIIVRETEGNPFFVQVAVESLVDELEASGPAGASLEDLSGLTEIPFPKSVTDALERRIARLSPHATRVLEMLAVAEQPIAESVLRDLGGAPEEGMSAGAGVEELVRRRLAAREVAADGSFSLRVDHVRIRDHVYETMNWQRRSDLHGRLGRALEARGLAGVEELAHHYLNSPDTARALELAEAAGMRALRLCSTARAIRFLEGALDRVPPADAPRRLALQLALADALRQARDPDRAAPAYERVIKNARAAGNKEVSWSATCSLLDVLWRAGQHEETQRLADRLAATLAAEGEKRHRATCLSVLGSLAAGRGDYDQARARNEEALALRREIGDMAGVAANLNNLGNLELFHETTGNAEPLFQESLSIWTKLGDPQRAAEVHNNLGVWRRRRGDLDGAAASLEEAVRFCRGHRDRWLLAQNLCNLAWLYHAQARHDRALSAAREAASCARAVGADALECEALDALGMVERELSHVAEAESAHERAASIARRAGLGGQEAYALISLALDRARKDHKAARESLRKAAKLAAGVRSPRLQTRLQEAWCRASLAAGDAAAALQQARLAAEAAAGSQLADCLATADLLIAESLLASGDAKHLPEAAEAAGRAAATARAGHLVEPLWQAHALGSAIEKNAGRRSHERDHLLEAAETLQGAAAAIADETIRLGWLSHPRRAELLRRAATLPERAVARGAHGSAPSAQQALSAIYEITGIISSMADGDVLLDRVLEVGLGFVGAERGLIILMDEATGEQTVAAARELEEETVRDALAYSHSVVKEAAAGRIMFVLDTASDERFRDCRSVSLYSIKSLMCVPMRARDRIIGTVYVDSRRQGSPFNDQDLQFLQAFANLAGVAVEQARMQERLSQENVYLRREAGERNRFQNIIGRNPRMQAVYDMIEKVAASNLPVLIVGESGTGKELVARALHYSSPRRHRKFFSENVAAIPDTLLESEMFGHARGAFTGADRDRKGVFELADGGTLFLDEIGDMSLPLQSKLLRALQEGEIRPVGGHDVRKVDVRVISATNKDLDRLLTEGKFREDLYFRLNVVRITLPPLRERKEDIPLLVDHFLHEIARKSGVPARKVEVGALQLLLRYAWPGNIRELENEIQRLAVICAGDVISQRDVMESGDLFEKITRLEEKDTFTPLEEMERRQIQKALAEAMGNRGRAAELLGISRATIFRKLRKFGISH